ncbi:SusD family protein [Chitinophaga jiangningensis]|uniref:SusD family protein n=1 Tax=Chitinophaga jiangningensis TaxID=1419482 RepID=A0A1M6WLP8_9BACT|nr:RagB/SusD family nutrient uptake outer membrane protein [Chitinophaga jiangningensis]SHK94524.1 SusD family protein [Chitinophaga jiangningensis]
MRKLITTIFCGAVLIGASSCNKYLEIVPRGDKIPQTLLDYRGLIESGDAHVIDYSVHAGLVNDWRLLPTSQTAVNLGTVNYNWQESIDRTQFIQTDAGYSSAYKNIFISNVVINNVPGATTGTDAEKATLIAQARVARAISYFYLINTYAKTYDAKTAATDPGVIINVAEEMEQTLTQSTVQQVYDFMLKDLNESLPALPNMGANPMMAGKGTAYALLTKIYMFQQKYKEAEEMADKALEMNSQLFDYVKYYTDNKTVADGTSPSIGLTKYEFNNPENYYFNYGGTIVKNQGFYASLLLPTDSATYEPGDARFKINFVGRTLSNMRVFTQRRMDDVNSGGIRTPEIYYAKAECLARSGKYAEAMEKLNTVRRKRIIASFYKDLTAATEAEAIALIRKESRNEYRGYGNNYLDNRRFNNDPVYRAPITKTENGATYTITPDSHLWIFPFSQTSIAYGEGRLVQNSH